MIWACAQNDGRDPCFKLGTLYRVNKKHLLFSIHAYVATELKHGRDWCVDGENSTFMDAVQILI